MKFKESIMINAPIDRVFDAWTDVEKYPEWADPVVDRTKITEGPVAVGTRFRCIDRWPGRQMTFEMEITQYEKNKQFGAEWFEPMKGNWTSRLSEASGGTLLEFEIEMKPPLLMRLLSPVMRRYATRENRKFMESFRRRMEGTA